MSVKMLVALCPCVFTTLYLPDWSYDAFISVRFTSGQVEHLSSSPAVPAKFFGCGDTHCTANALMLTEGGGLRQCVSTKHRSVAGG